MNLRSRANGFGRIAPYLLLIASLVVFSATAYPQATTGDISGTVVDKTNSVIGDAKIVATRVDTNQSFTATTNAGGEFHFANLPIGAYNLSATAKGFKATVLKDFPVELNKTASARMEMEVGEVSVTVEVTSAAPTIDTTTSQLGTTFDSKLQDYPTVASGASGVLNLSLLQPGVGSSGGIGAGVGPSIGGQRPRNNSFTIDGVDDNGKTTTGPSIMVPNDSVQEFTVLQNVFSPEFGHSNGGQFNTVTKSGTNSFHGVAYEYLKNRNLNAIDATVARPIELAKGVPTRNRFDDNRFGGQVGGPIIRNKAFFFVNYQYNPVGENFPPSGTIFAPTAAGYATLAAIPGVSATNIGILQKYLPAAPGFSKNVTVNGTPVPVGALPINAPFYQNSKNLVISGDYDFSSGDRLTVRDIYDQNIALDNTANLAAFFLTNPTINHFATIQEVHNFSPAVLNEFRLGFHRFTNTTNSGNFQYPGLDQFPNIVLFDLNLNLGPNGNGPQFSITNTYQMVDNVSWNRGNHNFKFGTELRKYISPQQFTQRARGDYEYNTLDLFARDLSPDVLGERSTGNSNYYGDQMAFYWFANDNWKIRHNLTVNLGLRYEYTTVPFTERLQSLNQIANVPGLITFNEPHYPKNAFAPRVGFAYTPTSDQKTVVRGGFSMGYDVLYDNIGILSLPPEFGSTVDVDLTTQTPNFLANGGIKPGGTGLTTFATAADAIAATSNHVVENIKLPVAIQWTLGVQHSFAKAYTVEVRYVGTHAYHLNVQDRINEQSRVTPTSFIPTYLTAPSQATLDASTITLAGVRSNPQMIPAYKAAGFTGPIVQFSPLGSSIYHGLSVQVNRRFTNGLQFQGAYTFSKNIDNSTADFFSTVITPRRPQDFQNLAADRSNSALDHRNRLSFAAVYDAPWYKNGNWFMKNAVGNWQVTPIYTYETGEWADVQSNVDSNLNGDSAGDRAIFNPKGVPGTGSGLIGLPSLASDPVRKNDTALCTSALPAGVVCDPTVSAARPFIVGYLAKNPNAQFITAQQGALATAGRNNVQLPPIDNIDLSILKRFSMKEKVTMEFGANISNVFNHPQFIAGFINDIAANANTTNAARGQYLNPASSNFLNAAAVFPSNSRTIGLVAKIKF
jgi:Carboxypeptidase regulatory-like domain